MKQELASKLLRSADISRRDFAAKTASSLLGVGLLGNSLASKSFAAFEGSSKLRQAATAKNVIFLYMSGGQSHMDTWDVKEGVETAGPTKPIKTSADGVRISEYLPSTA
ncbi:MAG: DUF1501 domain-containing protein, partial [Prosthecobacter sp.]